MENIPIIRYPQILVSRANSEKQSNSELKPLSPEPEVEECCEDIQLREVIESLGIDFEIVSQLKYITHDNQTDACLHCKLLSKVSALQDNIGKISQEISSTQELLKIKKIQNNDLKSIIDRLEGSIGHSLSSCEINVERTSKTCSCGNSCIVI
ncbi:hypothetical protein SteCoe_12863 [Stentor coeruleus]|uniref:Uncharacterized protein n=1 Tax=Stentor coeruleus TaxID=5963 RepID=A0A1R2C9R2_9CILI|nr:hypothetical protein SteCoe_12863 [Stentor coeruleus]